MAKRASAPKLNYGDEVRVLKGEGPRRLYLLYGEEDYLRERFLETLRAQCLGDGEAEFNYKRIDAASPDPNELSEAFDALPFMAERTFVELHSFDINKYREADGKRLMELFADLPEYCTCAVVLDTGYVPDGRLSLIKQIKKIGKAMEFEAQSEGALTDWVIKRFAAFDKRISPLCAQHLLHVSGTLMNRLIPEIEKVASYAHGVDVTQADIDATAQRIPEADVFEMCDFIGAGRFDEASVLLRDLLDSKEHPIMLLALIGNQMRRLYAVRLAQDEGRGNAEAMELSGVKFDFALKKLQNASRRFEIGRLAECVGLCAEYDFRMKSTGTDGEVLIKELFSRLAAGSL